VKRGVGADMEARELRVGNGGGGKNI